MITEDLQGKLLNGIEALAQAINEQDRAAKERAEADHAYRQAKAKAFTEFVADGEKRTVAHLEAMVDLRCDKQMWRFRLAEANHETAIERVRSLRTEISAFQSILNCYRAEAEAIRFNQGMAA
jgi:hypothetical protein